MPQPPPRLYAVSVMSGATGLNPILGKDREGDINAVTREPGDQPDKWADAREQT